MSIPPPILIKLKFIGRDRTFRRIWKCHISILKRLGGKLFSFFPKHASLPLCHCYSVAKSSDSLQLHELRHARLLCPLLSPRVRSYSCPLSQWCHPTTSSSVTPFSSFPQSFPASGSFPVSWLFASGGHRIGASAQSFQWIFRVDFLLDWLIWSWQSKGLSRVFSSTTIRRHQFFGTQPSLWSNPYICTWLLEKP